MHLTIMSSSIHHNMDEHKHSGYLFGLVHTLPRPEYQG